MTVKIIWKTEPLKEEGCHCLKASAVYICHYWTFYLKQNGKYTVNKRGTDPDELCEGVVDVGSAWHEETTARAEIMEEEQLLILWSRQRRLFNDFRYPYYVQVQPARNSGIHSRELFSHHAADHLSATDYWKKTLTDWKKRQTGLVCPGSWKAGHIVSLQDCEDVSYSFPPKKTKIHYVGVNMSFDFCNDLEW